MLPAPHEELCSSVRLSYSPAPSRRDHLGRRRPSAAEYKILVLEHPIQAVHGLGGNSPKPRHQLGQTIGRHPHPCW